MAVNNGSIYPSAGLELPFPYFPPPMHFPGAPSHGAKPPPLTVVTSSGSKATRTTATVNPLNQSASTVTVTSANSTNHAMAATRTSSFAAALRKLAKHANDNGPEEHSPRVSPVSMNRSTASTPSTKNFHFGPSPLVVPTSTPPVVTIAPTHTNNSSIISEQRRLSQELDRHGHHNSSEQHNSSRHSTESGNVQNSIWRSKGSPGAGPRRPVPQHLKPEESNPVRGFQPYRSGETEMTPRPPAPAPPPPPPPPPSHLTYDPAMMAAALSPYPFHQAFMGPPHIPYHGFRPEDSYERYSSYPGLRPPPFIPFSSPPSHLFPHPAMNPLAFSGLRYPSDLAAMQLSHLSPGVSFGGLVSPSAQHEREKLLLDQQRDRERRAEEAKQEAAQKEKQQQQQQQRETERENHDRTGLSRSQEDKRNSPRDGSHLRPSNAHHHNHHHHHHHHQQLAHSQHHPGSPRVPSSSSSALGHRGEELAPLPLLKKADGEDRWHSKHLKDGSSNDVQYRHVRNSQATSHENHIAHTSEKERKSSHHERELLLQQDRRIAERHEKERTLLREQRNQSRGDHHHSSRPPPLVSPVRPSREEIYRHKLFNNHRPASQDTVIPPQYDYERLNSVDRILLNDKSSVATSANAATTSAAAEKAWYEQQRSLMANRVQSPHGNAAREFDHEARVVANSHGPPPPQPATAHSKSSHLSQYDYDRPHAEFNYHLQEFYRINQQARELQNSHSGDQLPPPPTVQLNENGEPVVSKLDLEGRQRLETRANGIYISSESESDSEEETEVKRERYRKRMHRIVRKSCMTLDDSEKKTNFFQVMGLVTHGKKEEINEEKRRKRRIWLKEDQPTAKVRRPSSEPASLLPSPAKLSQEDFQRELDYPHKCRFLRGLGLDVVGRDKRKEMEKARAAVEVYRIRQAKKKEAAATGEEAKGKSESAAGGSETAQTPAGPTNSGTDSKAENSENAQCKTAVGETFPNHLVSSPGAQAHLKNERTLLSGGSSTPQTRTPDNMLHGRQATLSEKDIKKEPSVSSERADLPRCSSKGSAAALADQKEALPFSTAALLSRGGPATATAAGKSSQFEGFAQEFHQSVLRTTQEAMAHQRVGTTGPNLLQVDPQRRDKLAHAGLTNSNTEGTGPSRNNAPAWPKGQLQWPGVEAVMDSYQRHAKEQELERSVLLDQQSRLRVCNGELNSAAEQLRLKMADLMERKQLLHREQEAYLRDLHHLQKYVYDMRK
ncbi:genetic suppressor element 1-like isoform X2 [Patiria miniata]|uniref:Genetic suppressor element-like domain-containing protein n=1 Tax=Patiria miniata TaxID=46514 RepID=A0A914BKJ9_PATMI|nr:genetic suppressor element 1-like isoform X2 [Patiria miniata]